MFPRCMKIYKEGPETEYINMDGDDVRSSSRRSTMDPILSPVAKRRHRNSGDNGNDEDNAEFVLEE